MVPGTLIEYEWTDGVGTYVFEHAGGKLETIQLLEPSKPRHLGWSECREQILSARPRVEMIRDSMFCQLADSGRAPRAASDTLAS